MRVNDVPQGNETSISPCPVSFTQVPFPSSRPAYFLIHVSHPCMLQNLKKISFLEFLFKSSSTTVPYVGIFFLNFFPEGSGPSLKVQSNSMYLATGTYTSKIPSACFHPFEHLEYMLWLPITTLTFYLVLSSFQLFA